MRLPQTLKRIERSAFGSCYNLKKIVLPEHLEYIAASCFNSSGLESVFLPPNVAQIQERAFYGNQLREVVFSDACGPMTIGDYAFGGNDKLVCKRVVFPREARVSRLVFE